MPAKRALQLWRAAGDRLREGDTMRRLSRTMGRLCRGREAVAAAERDITTWATSLRGERTSVLEKTGRWDEAVALSTELLDRADPSPINRVYPLSKLGLIRGRRGEPGAWEYLDEAMTDADRSGEPQRIVPVRLARAEVYWLAGKTGEAGREVELADDGSANCDAWDRGAVAVWLCRTASARARAMTSPSRTGA